MKRFFKHKSAAQTGITHFAIPALVFVLLFGSFGIYYYIASNAATVSTPVTSAYSAFCLDDPGNTAKPTALQVHTCNKSAEQTWSTGHGLGQIEIHGNCIGTQNDAVKAGTPIVTTACSSGGTTKKTVEWRGTKAHELANEATNRTLCLTINSKSTPSNGTSLILAACQRTKAQTWTLQWGNDSNGSGGGSGGGTSTLKCASSPHTCGFPDATNTGPVGCTTYKAMSGNIKVTTNGTTYNCVKMTGSFDVYANNVTIENSIITSSNWWGINLRGGYSGLKVLHNSITGDVGHGPDNGGEDYAVSAAGEIGYNNISEFGDAISVGEGNIHDNYVHDLQSYIPICGSGICSYYQHTDDVIADGNNKNPLTINHNTLFNQMSTAKGASASIGLFADFGPVVDTTVNDNLIAGGAYALYPGGGATSKNIIVTNNHFSTLYWPGSGVYGPDATSYWHTGGGNQWSGNIWDDGTNAGKTVNP